MKQYRALLVVLMLAAVLMSACGALSPKGGQRASPTGGANAEADIILTGIIQSMSGTQWVVNGQPFTVESAVVHNGPYKISDVVKVEGNFQFDGSVLASTVGTPSANDLASATALANSNTNGANSSNANLNTNNSNVDNSNGNDNGGSGGGRGNDNGGRGGANDNGGGGGSNNNGD